MSKEADKLVDDLFDDVDDMDETLFDDDDEVEELEDEPVAPAGKDETKAFSERLKKEKEKMAKQLGYDSWEDALEKRTNSAMLDKGLDPETVKPLLKEMLKSDPDYVAAMEYKKDKEELEKKIWADNELKKLNDKYGLSLKSIDDLDDEVIKLWNGGLALDKAYAAEHYDELQAAHTSKRKGSPSGKEHLINPGQGAGEGQTVKKATKEEIRVFKMFNPGVSEEDINKFINK